MGSSGENIKDWQLFMILAILGTRVQDAACANLNLVHTHTQMHEHGHTRCYIFNSKYVISSSGGLKLKTPLNPGETGTFFFFFYLFLKPNKSGVTSTHRIYVLDL